MSVIALVGERGREVREFVEDVLGPEGLARSVVVVATSDEPALLRLRAAYLATRIAEDFADAGTDVLLTVDSLTRLATAQREIGLAAGEPPTSKGYPPSVFALLPRLLERSGPRERGTITAFYTVLVEGGDHDEPIADAARSILDGHLVLDRTLTTAGRFPAIDPLASLSRLATTVTTAEQQADALTLRRSLAAADRVRDLVEVGAYVPGTDRVADAALGARTRAHRVPVPARRRPVQPRRRVAGPHGPGRPARPGRGGGGVMVVRGGAPMNRDRLTVVLRLRELVERQRLAERAAALRDAAAADGRARPRRYARWPPPPSVPARRWSRSS